jgi:SAM-dependent methyltransferase
MWQSLPVIEQKSKSKSEFDRSLDGLVVALRDYNNDFMDYAAQSSRHSAAVVTSILYRQIKIDSVLDVGCAKGTWLRMWSLLGLVDLHGIDGDYIDVRTFEVASSMFTPHDLNRPFDLGRQFDLVQSLEVGEHIEECASEDFVESISRHAGRYVLFSAAPPGQGGEHHINEKPYEYWREKFEQRGFVTIDAVRPAIADDKKVSYWYRYNTVLFVRKELLAELSIALQDKILGGEPFKDVSPLAFRLRKAIVRNIPNAIQHEVARLKSKILPTGRI